MKTVLVTGANGQLGSSIHARISQYPGYNFLFTDIDTLDICDKEAVRKYVLENDVQYVMNCAAYTAVDKAEEHEDLCMRINRDAVRNLGEAAHAVGAKVIHVSTDYVFDGTSCRPYLESDATCPVSVYGCTKLAGEQALMEVCPDSVIIRTAWLYSEFGKNFCKTMMNLTAIKPHLKVVFDQVGTPTYALDLAKAIETVLKDYADKKNEHDYDKTGIYHYSNEGVCSWFDFTKSIAEYNGTTACDVQPCHSDEFPSPVKRPFYSVLDKSKIKETFGIRIPYWTESLRQCIANIKNK